MDEKAMNTTFMETNVGKEADRTPGTPQRKGASGGPGGSGGALWQQGAMGQSPFRGGGWDPNYGGGQYGHFPGGGTYPYQNNGQPPMFGGMNQYGVPITQLDHPHRWASGTKGWRSIRTGATTSTWCSIDNGGATKAVETNRGFDVAQFTIERTKTVLTTGQIEIIKRGDTKSMPDEREQAGIGSPKRKGETEERIAPTMNAMGTKCKLLQKGPTR